MRSFLVLFQSIDTLFSSGSAPLGSNITLDCHIEAYPLPLNYWTFGKAHESIYISGPKYEVSVKEKGYKRHLRLTIHKLEKSDLGTYRCHAQNSLGRLDKQVLIYGECAMDQYYKDCILIARDLLVK